MRENVRIVAFEPDLLFSSKIESAANKLGLQITLESNLQNLLGRARETQPHALLVNLDAVLDIISLKKLFGHRGSSVAGYYSHVNRSISQEAYKAGFDLVLTRGAFVNRIEEILLRLSKSTAPALR